MSNQYNNSKEAAKSFRRDLERGIAPFVQALYGTVEGFLDFDEDSKFRHTKVWAAATVASPFLSIAGAGYLAINAFNYGWNYDLTHKIQHSALNLIGTAFCLVGVVALPAISLLVTAACVLTETALLIKGALSQNKEHEFQR
jgi:hypothetical protein